MEEGKIRSFLETTADVSLGAGGSIVARNAIGQQGVMGLLYAFGAEPIVANAGMGAVFSDQNYDALRSQAKYGLTNIQASNAKPSGNFFQRLTSSPVTFAGSLQGEMYTASGTNLVKGGVITGSKVSAIAPLIMNVLGGIHTVADEGIGGLPGYMVRDAFANYYAIQNTVIGGDIIDAGAVAKKYSLEESHVRSMKSVQYTQRIAGMPLLSRISSIMTGHIVAGVGATAGQSLMKGLASKVNQASGIDVLNEDISGMFGYIFGAAGGAKIGASLGASMLTLGVAAIGAYAIKEQVSSTYAMVEGGFARAQRNKGINYAGDTAAFFTQNAVTMRERALQAMNKSHMNARSAFGQEANIVHMNRDMFSHHKRY